jgi:hypothetical protein
MAGFLAVVRPGGHLHGHRPFEQGFLASENLGEARQCWWGRRSVADGGGARPETRSGYARGAIMPTIYDTILWLQSRTTARRFPTVELSADVDFATNGWVSLTSINGPRIVVTQANAEEHAAVARSETGESGFLLVERRVNAALARSDLRCTWLVRVEDHRTIPKEESFRRFAEAYRAPTLLYRDIYSAESVAVEVSRTTRSAFESTGGTVIVLE